MTLTINGNDVIILNDPGFNMVSIEDDETVRFVGGTVVILNTTSSESFIVQNINRFSFVDLDNSFDQVSSPDPFPAVNGPGTLYWHSRGALLSKSNFIDTNLMAIRLTIPPLRIPPSPVEVLVTQRITPANNIVLNVDAGADPPDGVPNLDDDIIELTGSSTFMISSGQTLSYSGGDNTLLVRSRSVIDRIFDGTITNFYVLEATVQDGISGLRFRQFNSTTGPSPALIGPGQLRVGTEGGQTVAFYSTAGNVNQDINSQLVNMQFRFESTDTTAEIFGIFPTEQRLLGLNGAQLFTFPTATRVTKTGPVISVRSGSQLLQQFDTGTPARLSSFINHRVETMIADVEYDLPSGGAALYFNAMDNEAFLYPARNQFIASGISQAIENANIVPEVTTASYTLSSDEFGIGQLFAKVEGTADEVEVVNVAPASVIDVGSRESISYTGGSLEILNSDGVATRQIDGISPFTVNAAGSEYLSSMDSLATTFGGPGRLYLDSLNRAFYTRNSGFQDAITSFVNGIPEPRIDVRRDPNSNLVFFETGGQNLFNLNGADVVTAGPETAGVYFNNEINLVNRFDVPDNAQVMYNMARDVVRVIGANGQILFEVPAGTLLEYNDTPTRTETSPTVVEILKNSNYQFPFANGNVYYSDRGTLVTSSDAIVEGINLVLFSMGAGNLDASVGTIQGISNLTSADGSSIVTYNGNIPFALPVGGTYYSSGMQAMFVANRDFNSRVPGTYSRFNPIVTSYNGTTGLISLTTSEGILLSNLFPGVTTVSTISRSGSIHYGDDGTVTFIPAVSQPLRMISEINVWDGLALTTFVAGGGGNFTLDGPGIFWEVDGTGFYTADRTTVNRVSGRINNVIRTFRRPSIISQSRTFRSKFANVQGSFPQMITIYEGANVDLTCSELAGNPPSTISFFERIFNETLQRVVDVRIPEDDDTDNYVITQSASDNVAVLEIGSISSEFNAVNRTGVFTCVAENILGSTSRQTTVNILPASEFCVLRISAKVPNTCSYIIW